MVQFYTESIYHLCVELFSGNVPESDSLKGSYDRYSMHNIFLAYSDACEWAEQVKDVILESIPRDKCSLNIEISLVPDLKNSDEDDDED